MVLPTFGLLPADGRAAYQIGHGGVAPSCVDLPIVRDGGRSTA